MSFDDGRVVSNFIVQALQKSTHYIWRWLSNKIFLFIDDLVSGLISLMNLIVQDLLILEIQMNFQFLILLNIRSKINPSLNLIIKNYRWMTLSNESQIYH